MDPACDPARVCLAAIRNTQAMARTLHKKELLFRFETKRRIQLPYPPRHLHFILTGQLPLPLRWAACGVLHDVPKILQGEVGFFNNAFWNLGLTVRHEDHFLAFGVPWKIAEPRDSGFK